MNKSGLGFEKAHTLLLCLLYLPIPQFVVLLIFEHGIVCHIMMLASVIELIMANIVFLGFHKCPGCNKHVVQFHIHKDSCCHFCGFNLLEMNYVVSDFVKMSEQEKKKQKAPHMTPVADVDTFQTQGLSIYRQY